MPEGGIIKSKMRHSSCRHFLMVRVGGIWGGGMYFGWPED